MNMFDQLQVLNINNPTLVASLTDGEDTVYGAHVATCDKQIISNLKMRPCDC